MKEFLISVPDKLGEAVENAAQEQGKTVDEVFAEAAKREMARRRMDKLKREGEARRGNLTDDEVDTVVNKAIEEDRKEHPRAR